MLAKITYAFLLLFGQGLILSWVTFPLINNKTSDALFVFGVLLGVAQLVGTIKALQKIIQGVNSFSDLLDF